jgi:glutamine synthetase
LARPLPSSLPEDLAALKNEYMCLIYSYILATFFSQAYIKLKEKEIKVGKGKKGRSWQIRQYYDV